MRQTINTIHRYIGLIAGCCLIVSSITGALVSFRPQLLAAFGPEAQRVVPQGQRAPLGAVLENAKKAISTPVLAPGQIMVSADPTYPVKVEFAFSPSKAPPPVAKPGARPPPRKASTMEAPNPIVLVNPYTAEVLPRDTAMSNFLTTVVRVHRGTWAGAGIVGDVLRLCMSYSVLMLFVLVGTGLYQRWPRGRAAWRWQSWFKINFNLKGTPFYWNLHAVVGTCAAITLLLTAHTGLINSELPAWYAGAFKSIRQSVGAPGLPHPDKPSQIDPARVTPVWQAFQKDMPDYKVAHITLPAEPTGPVMIRSGPRKLSYDPGTATLLGSVAAPNVDHKTFRVHIGGGEANLYQPFWPALLNGNIYMHTGQRWGLIGQIIMFLSTLSLPVLIITGWLLYLRRRPKASRKRVKLETAARPN